MKISAQFTATLERYDRKGSWTYVIWPESKTFFGTGGLVKITGTIDGQPFRASFMAMGDGRQMLPIKQATRQLIGKDVGEQATIELKERLD